MDTNTKNISPHRALIAVYIALLIFLSCLFVICAYIAKEYPGTGYSTSNPRIIAFEDPDGRTLILSPDNSLKFVLEESGTVSDITLSANGDRIFYILHNGAQSLLCTRTLSSLVNDRDVLSESTASYLISKANKRIAYITEKGTLYYINSTKDIIEVAIRTSSYYLSEDGRTLIYNAKNESGKMCVYMFDGKSSSLLYENADILDVNGDLDSLLLSSVFSLIRFDVKKSAREILSESFGKLEANYGDVVYYSSRHEDGSSSLFCFNGSEKLISDKLSSVVFTASSPILVYTELSEDNMTSTYNVIIGENSFPLSGEELQGFTATEDSSQLFYNDVSDDQEMLIKATISDGGISKFTVVDTDTDHICGLVSGKIVYIKNFNPISNTADLYCNSEKLRSDVSLNEISQLPDHTPRVRSYTWVHRGIVNTGYACIDIYGADALTYSANGRIFTFDGKYETDIGIGEIKNTLPISADTFAIKNDGMLSVSKNGRVKDKKSDISRFILIKPYGAE